jgi:hypothetical protein
MLKPFNAILAVSLAAMLTACGPEAVSTPVETAAEETVAEETPAPAAEAPVQQALVPSGEPQTLMVETTEYATAAASVVKVDFLANQGEAPGVKLFGTAGGDPAANGLYTYIAFYISPGGDWAVFPVGDFIDYRILSDAPGRVDLEITETTIDEETAEMGSAVRRVIINWTAAADEAAPESVTVTPAE